MTCAVELLFMEVTVKWDFPDTRKKDDGSDIIERDTVQDCAPGKWANHPYGGRVMGGHVAAFAMFAKHRQIVSVRVCARRRLIVVLLIVWCAASSCTPDGEGVGPGKGGKKTGCMAFVSRRDSVNHIYLMDIDASGAGSNLRKLTLDSEPENYPSWSPDGQRLLYQRDFHGTAIYVINADGTGRNRLSPTPGFDVNASWSPDGTKIIYARIVGVRQPGTSPATEIRIMNADGSGGHAIFGNGSFAAEPRWSVNDQVVFFSNMNSDLLQIYTMNIDGTHLRQLTTEGNNGDPVWSPDGSQITFGSDREGGNRLNIFVMNADGSQQEPLTHFDAPIEVGDTNWSSDGRKIAFQYGIDGKKQSDPNAHAEVWIMNPDGSAATATGIPCTNVGCAPRWRPMEDL